MDDSGWWAPYVVVGALLLWFLWLDDSQVRYALQYDVSEVSVEDKPHDCDFMTAPLGRKNCSYEKKVELVKFSVNKNGQPIVSYDKGATWYLNEY